MTNIDSIQLASIFGGVGVPQPPTKTEPTTTAPTTTAPTTTQPTTTQPAPQQPTFFGNLCRAGYTSLGAAVGGVLTSETGGWGTVPGALVGNSIGQTVCPP